MYSDTESIKDFERRHLRDQLALAARHIGEDSEPEIVSGHFRLEKQEALVVKCLMIAGIALIGVMLLFV